MNRAADSLDLEGITRRFFSAWGGSFDDMCASFDEVLAPECVWEQRPMAVTQSREAALAFLRRSHRILGLDTAPVEILKIGVVGSTVMTERVDHLTRRDGTLIASLPVAGILEFRDAQVVRWREYFDPTRLVGQMVGRTIVRRPRVVTMSS